jgi:HMG (high mobility group) box
MLGAVTFEQLGKLIGERWRALVQEQRKVYEHSAHKDVLRYRKQMDSFEDARRQRFRHPHAPVPQHAVASYDSSSNTLPCVSFEDATPPPPIIHEAPPPLYQLPHPSAATADRDSFRTPSGSPEPTNSTTTPTIRPYPTTSCLSTTTTIVKGRTVPPVTPPTPRPVVLPPTTIRPGTNGVATAGNNNTMSTASSMNVDGDSPTAYQRQAYSYNSNNSSYYTNFSNGSSMSSLYQHPHIYSPFGHLPLPGEHQLVLPKPPGRCLGGPPEYIAIPQGMEVYLPITRTVLVSPPSRLSPPSSSSSSSSDGEQLDINSSKSHHYRHQQHQQRHQNHQDQQQRHQKVVVTGRRKYKVYYSAYRMKRSEADDYLNRLSDTLASWNTVVSATMASPTDSFVLNDDTTTYHETNNERTSAAAVVGPPRRLSPAPVTSHGPSAGGPSILPYYSSSYGEMRHAGSFR